MQTFSRPLDLDTLNAMSREAFIAALGPTFEHSPWVAQGAWAARPFASVDALHAAMLDVVRREPQATRLAFLCAHPELAGREAQASTMTADSQHEQASAELNAMSREEMVEMAQLNGEYRQRHGFPFIIAARKHTKAQIFDEMRRRIERGTQTEFVEAMEQISYITSLRVRALIPAA
ncbi:MAG: 2-oxo-4-hydroxy-4-carboxy-5-ureidoimidazoline decarboxylase [Polaromonas sp.]